MELTRPGIDRRTASVQIDLDAFAANIAALRGRIGSSALMVVLKADGYGHGMIECARAARAVGVSWLGVATPTEALQLRESGDTGSILSWLYGIDEDLTPLVAADVDVSAQSPIQLSALVAAAATTERPARVHLKLDTGLSRNGATVEQWPDLCAAAAEAEQTGAVRVVGIWSHFASADEPGNPSVGEQLAIFEAGLATAEAAGLRPELRHLCNSAGALLVPEAHFELVRVGIASYGIEPAPGLAALAGVQLQPVMRLRAQLAQVKQVRAGAGVSYGHQWTAPEATVLGLVPLGYGDGIPRHASNVGEVFVGGRRAPIRGRICMDQFVVDLGPGAGDQVGDEVVLFGPGGDGEPTAQDWARTVGTIGYEIVTRISGRVPRSYSGGR